MLKIFMNILVLFLLGALAVGCAAPPQPMPEKQPAPTEIMVRTAVPTVVVIEATAATSLPIILPSAAPVSLPSATPAAVESTRSVTLNDNNQSLRMHVGESFLLELGEIYNWEVTSSNPEVLSRVINIMVIRGAQGVYEAHQKGQVELTAVGDPLCRSVKPACMMPSLLFKINVTVE